MTTRICHRCGERILAFRSFVSRKVAPFALSVLLIGPQLSSLVTGVAPDYAAGPEGIVTNSSNTRYLWGDDEQPGEYRSASTFAEGLELIWPRR
jgi:hypothetical protein